MVMFGLSLINSNILFSVLLVILLDTILKPLTPIFLKGIVTVIPFFLFLLNLYHRQPQSLARLFRNVHLFLIARI